MSIEGTKLEFTVWPLTLLVRGLSIFISNICFLKCIYILHSLTEFVLLFHPLDDEKGQEVLCDLVLFWTGYPSPNILSIRYLASSVTKVLAEGNTCPLTLYIPVVHAEYKIFKDHLDKNITFGKYGFGKI